MNAADALAAIFCESARWTMHSTRPTCHWLYTSSTHP